MVDLSTEKLSQLAAYSGDPWTPDSQYFADAEDSMEPLWNQLIYPIIEGCDFRHTVDLAAGCGRNSAKLVDLAGRLTIMDIQPGNVEFCRRRFADRDTVDYFVNSGYDLRPVPDGDVTLLYCFDAMVHFDSDVVRAYLRDTHRVLAPGACALFHHSNYTGGPDWLANVGGRNFMSREMFAHYAGKEGLTVLSQQVISWAGETDIDCVTLLGQPAS